MASWGIESTAVELVPSVPQLFGYYHPDGPELLKSPLAHIEIDDGRRFLERSTEKFDVITIDPPPPVNAPTTSLLYSREFYAVIKNHLRPGGIVQVWLYTQGMLWDTAFPAAVVKALQVSFPYVRGFESLQGFGYHLLASNEPLALRDAAALASRLPAKAAADFVEWGPQPTAEAMFNEVVQKEVVVDRLAALNTRVPPIQDDQPINEYFLLRVYGYYR
jgi:spermidine synthase